MRIAGLLRELAQRFPIALLAQRGGAFLVALRNRLFLGRGRRLGKLGDRLLFFAHRFGLGGGLFFALKGRGLGGRFFFGLGSRGLGLGVRIFVGLRSRVECVLVGLLPRRLGGLAALGFERRHVADATAEQRGDP